MGICYLKKPIAGENRFFIKKSGIIFYETSCVAVLSEDEGSSSVATLRSGFCSLLSKSVAAGNPDPIAIGFTEG